jgi:hypothetical protein
MTSRRQFGLILASVLALTALISHAVARWVGMDLQPSGRSEFGRNFRSPPVLIACSSMLGAALDTDLVAADLSRHIEGVFTAGASPCELEILTRTVPDADLTIVGVSVYELDEQFIAEFRADIVPISQTVRDLLDSHVDWPFFKRTMSLYPLRYLQWLFPTAGRGVGIMVGVRSKLRRFGGVAGREATEALPMVKTGATISTVRVADWPAGRVLRQLSEMRSECRDLHGFNGPKHLAFRRMVRRLATQGKVLIVVLPLSPPYENDLLKPQDRQAFEKSLEDIAKQSPEAKWIRLDRLPELHSTEVYWDLLHLNLYGRRIATKAFRAQLSSLVRAP